MSSFDQIHEYPVATATHKAVEVYERLVVCRYTHFTGTLFIEEQETNPDDPPDLVIGGTPIAHFSITCLVHSYAQPTP